MPVRLISRSTDAPEHRYREYHDFILNNLEMPGWLLNDSLLDDVWRVRTSDFSRKPPTKFDFGATVHLNAKALNDGCRDHDLVTAKLYVFYGLGTSLGWTSDAESMHHDYMTLLDFIRWRNEAGLRNMSELSMQWFSLFKQRLHSGRSGLLPYADRVASYVHAVQSGDEILPLNAEGLDSQAVARRLGLAHSNQIPKQYYWSIVELLREVSPYRFNRIFARRRTLSYDGGDENEGLIQTRIANLLRPWEALWSLRRKLKHDPISFNAFSGTDTRNRVAHSISDKQSVPTPVPPPKQTCFLINAALELIFEHEHLLRTLHDDVLLANRDGVSVNADDTPSGAAQLEAVLEAFSVNLTTTVSWDFSGICVWQRNRAHHTTKVPDARTLLYVLLPAACAIVIAAFSARRRSEVENVRDDCIFFDDHGGSFLTFWIQKSHRDYDQVPVPQSVHRAVDVLKWLSKNARGLYANNWLFNFYDPVAKLPVSFQINEALQAFADHVNVPSLPDGSKWVFRSHQFRSFFATMYYHQFEYPSLTALRYFLDHFDLASTKGYVTKIVKGSYLPMAEEKRARREQRAEEKRMNAARLEMSRDFELVRQEVLLNTAKGIAFGDIKLSGFAGDIWTQDIKLIFERAKRASYFVSERDGGPSFDAMLKDWLAGRSLEPNPAKHSYCACGSTKHDLDTAACANAKRSEDPSATIVGPEPSYAADLVCSKCPHGAQMISNKPYWDREWETATNAAEGAPTMRQRVSARNRADAVLRHIHRSFPDAANVEGPSVSLAAI